MLQLLAHYVRCPILMDLLDKFLTYSVEKGGYFHTPRDCPLSPLLAGFHLYEIDLDLSGRKCVRYLLVTEDLLILARTCRHLRRAIASTNRWFAGAELEQHPDKSFIGRVECGSDWLDYRFDATGLRGIAARTREHFEIKPHR